MPASAFNVGRDSVLVIRTQAGILDTASLTKFTSKPMMATIKSVLITGRLLSAYLPEGWEGSFDFTRQSPVLDDFFAKSEDQYYAGNNLISASINETITEVDGSVSQYRYTDVALMLDDPGSWEGNKEVSQKVSFMASRRRKIA